LEKKAIVIQIAGLKKVKKKLRRQKKNFKYFLAFLLLCG